MTADRNEMSRRQFTATTSFAAAAVVAGGASRVLGANDRVVLASIGIRGQGNSLKQGFAKLPGVEIKTLCDIDENLVREPGERPRLKGVATFKPGLREGPSAGSSTTGHRRGHRRDPDHWHALPRSGRCRRASTSTSRSRRPTASGRAARWSRRQAPRQGHACRHHEPQPHPRSARRSSSARGSSARSTMARGLCFKSRPGIRKYPDGPITDGQPFHLNVEGGPVPEGVWAAAYLAKVNYDLWLGPAPVGRLTAIASTTTGTGTGITAMATPATRARTNLTWPDGTSNKNEHPVKISSHGATSARPRPRTPQHARGAFDTPTVALGVRDRGHIPTTKAARIGNLFYGTKGWALDRRRRQQVAELLRPQEPEGPGLRGAAGAGRQRPERPHEPGVVALRELRRRHPRERPEEGHLRHRRRPPVGLARRTSRTSPTGSAGS